jgi:hypothetical protein
LAQSEIVLAPGSGRPISLNLVDKDGNAIDFTAGTWSCRLAIVPYPMFQGTPYCTLVTANVTDVDGTRYPWLTLSADSRLVLTPDPDVTETWTWIRKHYECHLQGPNFNSKPDRVDHGPFKMEW